ncbi:polysaccharide biosynthesis tyrosine autokinase [candidate division KSB1 bacterium]|nr:polysaccharide biosynthesis tyrosine autokinase [candidate division KSB1 bacterium]
MEDLFYEDNGQQEEEGFDISKYIHIIFKRKWIIASIFILITIPWYFYLKSLPPTYEAFCDIEFRSLEGSTENIISESRIIKLRSRSFAEKVVAQLGLTLDVKEKEQDLNRHQLFEEFSTTMDPRVGEYLFQRDDETTFTILWVENDARQIVYKGTIAEAIQNEIQTTFGFNFKLNQYIVNLPRKIEFFIMPFKYAVQAFRERTNVNFRGMNILRLTMSDRDPVLVAKMVNRLAQIYVNESMSLKRTSIEDQKKIIEDKLTIAEQSLSESERKLKEFKTTHLVSLDAETETRVTELNEAENRLEAYIKQLADLDALLRKIDLTRSSDQEQGKLKYEFNQLTELPTFSTNYKMGALKKQLQDLEDDYNNLTRGVLTERHKRAIDIENDIALLYLEIETEARNHREEIIREKNSAEREINDLRYKLKQKLPEDQATLMVLERERRSDEEIYRQLKSQSQLAAISEAVETESIDILDPAIVPDYPVNRDKQKKGLLGAMFALALGFGVAFGLEFLDKSIKTVEDVKKYLKLQVLGTIPNVNFEDIGEYQDNEKMKQIDQQLVTYDYSPTPIGEAYRSLRTNLVFSKNAGRIQSLVLTSTSPGDGKSFTAANLAISMAQHRSNTLLIDADLRRGVLHNTFGVPKEPGFTNYLTNMASLAHIINETLIPNLSLISCGSLLPNPSELLGSHQMKRFLDEAKRKFDFIIFDSPPLNAATDAIVIGTQVDAVVTVVRSGVTNRNIARQKLELFKNVPARVLGVILNGTTAEFGHDGYSYYHY